MVNFAVGTKVIEKTQDLLGQRKAVKSIAEQTNSVVQKHIDSFESGAMRDALQGYFDVFSRKSGKVAQQRIVQLDEIIQKYNQCPDEEIKKVIVNSLSDKALLDSWGKGNCLDLIEGTLDAINSANDKYSVMYNLYYHVQKDTKVSKFVRKLKDYWAKIKKRDISDVKFAEKERWYSGPRKLFAEAKRKGVTIDTNVDEYMNDALKNYIKYSPLADFMYKYGDSQPEMVKHLYTKGYLEKQRKEVQEFAKRLDKKHGTTFMSYEPYFDSKGAYHVEKELDMFKQVMGAKRSLDYLEINPYDSKYILEEKVGAYHQRRRGKRFISMPALDSANRTFRHEMIHAIDENLAQGISPYGPNIPEKALEELRKAGAPEHLVEYAKKNSDEAKAVLGEHDITKYSKATKKYMVDNGLPKEVLKLREIDYYDYILKCYGNKLNKTEIQAFRELRSKLGGIIPHEVFKVISDRDPKVTTNVLKLVKNKKHLSKENFIKVFEASVELGNKKDDLSCIKSNIAMWEEEVRLAQDPESKQYAIDFVKELKERSLTIPSEIAEKEKALKEVLATLN